MTDLESRLRIAADIHEDMTGKPNAMADTIREAADALAAQGWIPCSDRLPQVGEWACVLTDWHAGSRPDITKLLSPDRPRYAVIPARLRMVDEEGNPTWEQWALASGMPCGILEGDTHWHPLPTPPAALAAEGER